MNDDDTKEVISTEASAIMQMSHDIDEECEKSIKELQVIIEKYQGTTHSKTSYDVYIELKAKLREAETNFIRIRGINNSIPRRVVEIEHKIKKFSSDEL